jgi:hypothetical protein
MAFYRDSFTFNIKILKVKVGLPTFLFCIRKVSGSNLALNTGYTELFRASAGSAFHANAETVAQIRS